jgi:hypothetical protein
MPLDANGVWHYTGPELAAPADDLLNRLAQSVSDQVARLNALRTVSASLASFNLSGISQQVLPLSLTPGTWDFHAVMWADWSVTIPGRYYLSLVDSSGVKRDEAQIYVNAATGSVPVSLMAPDMLVGAPNIVALRGYVTDYGGGPGVYLKNITMRARRIS